MRRLILVLCLAALPLTSDPMTPKERSFLLEQLDKSAKAFVASLDGLSEAQWRFKPGPDRWSIAECAEHVVITDNLLLSLVTQRLMSSPPPDEPPAKTMTDDEVLAGGTDRGKRIKTALMLEPTGKLATRAAVLEAFVGGRAKVVAYVKGTQDDLRGHGMATGDGYRDAYQTLLALSAHAERHAAQIAEVKATVGYPKN